MNVHCKFLSFSAFAFSTVLVLAACKSGTQQTSNQQPGSQVDSSGQPSQTSQQGTGDSGANPASSPASASAPAPQPPPPPAVVDLPVGTRLHVRLDQDLGSKISHPGDSFNATIAEDVEARRKFIEDNALDVKNLDI